MASGMGSPLQTLSGTNSIDGQVLATSSPRPNRDRIAWLESNEPGPNQELEPIEPLPQASGPITCNESLSDPKLIGTKVSLTCPSQGSVPTKERALAVLTSGGDCPGMNPALRAVVRVAIYNNMKPYAVYEGYQGLVEGGNKLKEISWSDVSGIHCKGGTIIGTARCKEFRTIEGRLKACENLVKRGINNLVVIGGDGSLTGANFFKEEWKGHIKKLLDSKVITAEQATECAYLNIVGLVGSIDNDMCGTDMTIGTDTCLHRIIEALDCLTSTASSHQRSFVLEVMGRHCGYLAQMAAIAGGADWVLIPENPPRSGWEDVMCRRISYCRQQGRRHSLVVISEGAVDTNNKPITSAYVKQVLEKQLGHDTRITVLGHVQRGGKPSAYDRLISCRMGAAAALTLVRSSEEIPSTMIGVQGNQIFQLPLMECVKRTRAVDKAMDDCDFKRALHIRGESYQRSRKILKRLESCSGADSDTSIDLPSTSDSDKFTFAIMNVGAPAAGMNGCVRAFVRLLLYKGHTVLGISEGFDGLLDDLVQPMHWADVDDWSSQGGSNLGTNRTTPDEHSLPEIAAKFGEYKIQGLLVIGGFEAFETLINLEKSRKLYTAFRIPLCGVAATISNNVPGTEYSLGCDTSLNVIVSALDILRQSAHASRKRVFVVETMGGHCGYLASMVALAGGADAAYIHEEKVTIAGIQNDINCLIGKFSAELKSGMLIRNESCSKNFTTEFLCKLLDEESKGSFVTRSLVLGHLQQGEAPSPFDRILGVKYASHAVDFLVDQATLNFQEQTGRVRAMGKESACMIGLQGVKVKSIPFQDLIPKTDFKHRISVDQWWMPLRDLIGLLAKHKDHGFLGEELYRK